MLALFQKVAFNSGNSKNSQVLKLLTQPTELIRVISTHSFSPPFPCIFPIFHDPSFLPKSPNFGVNVKIARLIHIQEMNSTLCCGRLKRQRITLIQKTQSFLWFLMTRPPNEFFPFIDWFLGFFKMKRNCQFDAWKKLRTIANNHSAGYVDPCNQRMQV